MKILDFHRSFLVFEIDFVKKPPRTVSDTRQNQHNRARVQIDCRCQITDPRGRKTDYFLGESCKTERVGATRETGVFIQPNADFRPVLSKESGVIFKSWDRNNKGVMLVPPSLGPQPERQMIKTREAFYRHKIQLAHVNGRALKNVESIIRATDEGRPLVARTEYTVAKYRVLLEYPILTFNVSEKYRFYQTDTGPVIYPELNQRHTSAHETFRLAFSAFSQPDWIEFIVQKPTPVGGGVSVNHYSESVQVNGCKNTIFLAGSR